MHPSIRAPSSSSLRELRPELLRQHFHVRRHVNPGVRHLLFVNAEDFSQSVEFRAHLVEHLPHGVHFHVAALVAFERESHGDVFRQLQQRRFVRGFRRRLRRQRRKRLAHRKSRASRQRRKPRLKCSWIQAIFRRSFVRAICAAPAEFPAIRLRAASSSPFPPPSSRRRRARSRAREFPSMHSPSGFLVRHSGHHHSGFDRHPSLNHYQDRFRHRCRDQFPPPPPGP